MGRFLLSAACVLGLLFSSCMAACLFFPPTLPWGLLASRKGIRGAGQASLCLLLFCVPFCNSDDTALYQRLQ